MKKHLLACTGIALILLMLSSQAAIAQNTRPDKLYSMSGFGFAFPVGGTADYYKPKFSTALGLNIGLGNGGWFLYPKLSLQAYSFFENYPDEGYDYAIQKGRSTTYLLNMALGYRKFVGKYSFYGFAGAGGGFILTARVQVNEENGQAALNNKNITTGIMEAGLGAEYNTKAVTLFLESSYMHGFTDIQHRAFNTVPLVFGIKPHLNNLFKKKD